MPAEYTKLDYIENVNGSYIDTGVNADYHLDVDIIFRSSVGANFCFGAINRPFSSASYYDRYHTTNNNNKYSFFWGSESYMSMQFKQMDTEKHRFKTIITKSEVSLDDDVRTIGIYREVDTALNYWLFKRNSNVSNLRYESKMKLYACKMWYKNELVRDFIPCKNQNNICGLYDLVEGKFYRSANNIDFEGGFEALSESEVS